MHKLIVLCFFQPYEIRIFINKSVSLKVCHGTVVAQWIRPWTLNLEIPSSNPVAMAVVPHCQVPQRGLKAASPLVMYSQAAYLETIFNMLNNHAL